MAIGTNTERDFDEEEEYTDSPRVSVLVFVHENDPNLVDCLRTVHNQILDDMEVLILVNFRDDRSQEIIADYAKRDQRMRVILCKTTDFAHAMNQGLALTKAEYVGFLHSSDFIDPEMYIELFALAKKFDADVVRCNYYDFHDGKNDLHEAVLDDEANYVIDPTEDTHIFYEPAIVWAGLYKKEYLQKENITFFEGIIPDYLDINFHIKSLTSGGAIVLSNKAYYHFRIPEPSIIKEEEKYLLVNAEFAEIERTLRKRKIYETFGRVLQPIKFASYYDNLMRLPESQLEKYALRVRAEMHDADSKNMVLKGYFPKENWKNLRNILKMPPQVFMLQLKKQLKARRK